MRRILLGCDVDMVQKADPVLRWSGEALDGGGDPWACLDRIDSLIASLGDDLPPITWLIRSDESVRNRTGAFDSGYLSHHDTWSALVRRGHELGWHMHTASFDSARNSYRFDPDPQWLSEAHSSLARHFPVTSTRTGWDYASSTLFKRLDALGIWLDFSSLPGNLAWYHAGDDPVVVDWLGACEKPYHPSASDHLRPGADALRMLEIPIVQFRNPISRVAIRYVRRVSCRRLTTVGLRDKTRQMTQQWSELPSSDLPVWAFYFHPEDLDEAGLSRFTTNLDLIRRSGEVEFVTASQLARP